MQIEKNMGFGAFQQVFTPILKEAAKALDWAVGLDEDYVTGQKELRIIATLEPVLNAGRLVVNSAIIESDAKDCGRYAAKDQQSYSFFFQLCKITKDRGSLVHDDRLDAVEGAVRYWQKMLAQDQKDAVEKQRQQERAKLLADPMGHDRYSGIKKPRTSLLNRYKR